MLFKYLLAPVLMVSGFSLDLPGTNIQANNETSSGWSGYGTNPQRFEFFGKKAPFSAVLKTIERPTLGNGTNVVLLYNNVAVILYGIPKERTLKVIDESMFKSLPHKVLTLDSQNNTKVINLDY